MDSRTKKLSEHNSESGTSSYSASSSLPWAASPFRDAFAFGGAALVIVGAFLWYTNFDKFQNAYYLAVLEISMMSCILYVFYKGWEAAPPQDEPDGEQALADDAEDAAGGRWAAPEARGHELAVSRGRGWSAAILGALAVWLLAVVLDKYRFQECVWQVVLTLTFFGCAHGYASSSWPCLSKVLLLVYLVALPFVTDDRMPFFQLSGCTWRDFGPSYAMSCLSLAVAAVAYGSGDVTVTMVYDVRPGEVPESSRGKHMISSEYFPLLCALLSIAYLWYIRFGQHISIGGHEHVFFPMYHLAWSYIRPAYTCLFAMYAATSSLSSMPRLQSLLSGFGMLHFSLLCPLADTPKTHHANMECVAGELHLMKRFTYHLNLLGKTVHRLEAMCFFFSVFMFAIVSLDSQVLRRGGVKVRYFIGFAMAASFGVQAKWRLDRPLYDLASHPSHAYFLLYGTVVVAEVCILLAVRRRRLVFDTVSGRDIGAVE